MNTTPALPQPDPAPESEQEEAPFSLFRHTQYWLRNLKTFLPQPYTSSDSNRMLLAFFIVAGSDLLGLLHPQEIEGKKLVVTEQERQGWIEWVYNCQLESGGFRCFSGTKFCDEGSPARNEANGVWDPAHVPGTFFALMILVLLGDDLERVRREECLVWLKAMQRGNGSFGEVMGENGPVGDDDLRFCHCAAGIRFILRGEETSSREEGNEDDEEPDIDVEKLVEYIESCQSYDGGFGGAPSLESHAGMTYCAIASLSYLGRFDLASGSIRAPSEIGNVDLDSLIRWLASRQTNILGDEYESDPEDEGEGKTVTNSFSHIIPPDPKERESGDRLPPPDLDIKLEDCRIAGMNGRMNKVADTCYCFWVGGTLEILGQSQLIEYPSFRRFLLNKTQHIVGGFGKGPGELPDVLHSYLGMAALSTMGDETFLPLDATLCISQRARRHLESLPWRRGYKCAASESKSTEPSAITEDTRSAMERLSVTGE